MGRTFSNVYRWLQALGDRRWWYVIIVLTVTLWTIRDDLYCKYNRPHSRFVKLALYFGPINCPGYEDYTWEGRQKRRLNPQPVMPLVNKPN